MKNSRIVLSASLLMSVLLLASCGGQTGSTTPTDETATVPTETAQTLPVNTSASAEEVVGNFMEAFVAGGYDLAKAYVAPDQRDASPLLSTWDGSMKITTYSNISAREPFGGMTNVTFNMKGSWADAPYEADGGLDTAEIDGVWWIVPYNYTAE